MKLQSLTLACTLALLSAGAAVAAGEHSHSSEPVHGGAVVEVKHVHYELVARPDVVQLHLRDHGKPIDVSNATARVTLLTGKDKQDVELKPAGDRLQATGTFQVGPGSKAVAVVTRDGKPSTARFVLK